jgi:hypothetical protein
MAVTFITGSVPLSAVRRVREKANQETDWKMVDILKVQANNLANLVNWYKNLTPRDKKRAAGAIQSLAEIVSGETYLLDITKALLEGECELPKKTVTAVCKGVLNNRYASEDAHKIAKTILDQHSASPSLEDVLLPSRPRRA